MRVGYYIKQRNLGLESRPMVKLNRNGHEGIPSHSTTTYHPACTKMEGLEESWRNVTQQSCGTGVSMESAIISFHLKKWMSEKYVRDTAPMDAAEILGPGNIEFSVVLDV